MGDAAASFSPCRSCADYAVWGLGNKWWWANFINNRVRSWRCPGGDNRNVTCAEANLGAWERDFPEPCGRGVWPRRNPGKPTPAQPWEGLAGHRPWDLAPLLAGSCSRNFFLLPSLLPFHHALFFSRGHSRGSPTPARTRSCNNVRRSTFVVGRPPSRASESSLGLSVLFHTTLSGLLILWAHNSRHPAGPRHFFASDCRHGLLMIATSWVTISFNHKISDREYVTPACLS